MARKAIQLNRKWTIGKQIGDRSGFGVVHEAVADSGERGALKFVPREPGAARELLFVDLADVPNVVPIVDSGETETHYVLAMPLADGSLRARILEAGGVLDEEAVVSVLRDVAAALAAMSGRVVHRDIKPENILLLDGHWCLADFGIARYAEATTATDTHKYAMTMAYAAPERWRFERATTATDVYALGVLAYEALTGALPFPGPTPSDFRAQHLTAKPPALPSGRPNLASLVTESLVKTPEARPTAANLVSRLDRIFAPVSGAAAALQGANAKAAIERSNAEAASASARTDAERRQALFDVARASLTSISDRLQELIRENAPEASTDQGSSADWWSLRLGDGTIAMDPPQTVEPDWGAFAPAFEVIAFATVAVLIPRNRYDYEGRSHSLWFCDAREPGVYRWFETAFMISPIIPRQFFQRPAAMAPNEDSGKALWRGVAEYQVAFPFTPIDQGDEDAFFERWLGWFARAAAGSLNAPSGLPEGPVDGSWRR